MLMKTGVLLSSSSSDSSNDKEINNIFNNKVISKSKVIKFVKNCVHNLNDN